MIASGGRIRKAIQAARRRFLAVSVIRLQMTLVLDAGESGGGAEPVHHGRRRP